MITKIVLVGKLFFDKDGSWHIGGSENISKYLELFCEYQQRESPQCAHPPDDVKVTIELLNEDL